MPWEATALNNAPYPRVTCPTCGAYPLRPFMRGLVQRSPRGVVLRWWGWIPIPWLQPRPYCAIICEKCKDIVGYESPPQRYYDATDTTGTGG